MIYVVPILLLVYGVAYFAWVAGKDIAADRRALRMGDQWLDSLRRQQRNGR